MKVPPLRDVWAVYRGRVGALLALSALWLSAAGLEVGALLALYAVAAAAVTVAGESAGTGGPLLTFLQRLAPGLPPLLAALVVYVVLDTLYLVVSFCQRALTQATSLSVRAAYNQRLFDTYLNSDFQFLLDRRHGEVMYRALSAPVQVGEMAVALPQLVAQSAMLLTLLALMLRMSVPVTVGLLVLSLGLFVAYELVARLWLLDFGHLKVSIRQRQSVLVTEALDGIKQFKVYGHLDRWRDGFRAAADDFAGMTRRMLAITSAPPHGLRVVSVVTFSIVALALMRWAPDAVTTYLPLITVYFVAVQRLLPSIAGIAQARAQLVQNVPALRAVESELTQASQRILPGAHVVTAVRRGIDFVGVGLSYPGRPDVLRNLSFTIPAGCWVGVVGPSGSGKSSVLNLLVRLFDPTSGVILVDGQDMRSLDTRAWRRHLGFVAQESFLFHGSVADNIAFGRDATAAQVRDAARLALAHEFIERLPDGYDTVVGEQGLKLSGGQRQRIGIARAILTSPPLLIFDEATSALDGPSEAAVQRSIVEVAKGRTVIMVAHRLASVRPADTILVVDQGTIVESGSHDALVAADGLYASLVAEDGRPAEDDEVGS
ncbi:MAG: multidrug ABC transporter ATP-binding protein [Acidimicrobiia bacterium]